VSGQDAGKEIYCLVRELFPICRSITGNGVRRTLEIVGAHIPLQTREVPTGTQVFDWTVPKEWNVRDAYIEDPLGRRIVEFARSNLHVLNYSVSVDSTVSLEELKRHLYTLPAHPDWVPYRTSYYKEDWGFCLSHNQLLTLEEGYYRVVVDSTLKHGHLSYGECLLPGESSEEILVSTHVCHPSLANDNLSGIAVATFLARYLTNRQRRYSYRFLLIPGTIGAITWLSLNQGSVAGIRHGLVLAGLGDPGRLSYKKSRRGNADIDRVAQYVLKGRDPQSDIREFSPYGYDERQYCSPGFNLPVGRLSRTPYGEYEQYHSSADNLEFVSSEKLGDSYSAIVEIFEILERDGKYRNVNGMCEPQLGKRGLYDAIGPDQLAMLWVLNLSDGDHSLLDIAERSGIEFDSIRASADVLRKYHLIE
jgi:aminopeptidase-like protein